MFKNITTVVLWSIFYVIAILILCCLGALVKYAWADEEYIIQIYGQNVITVEHDGVIHAWGRGYRSY